MSSSNQRRRANSSKKSNIDETVASATIHHTNHHTASSKKTDHPIVLLSRTNYVEFMQGLICHMTQKEGGADLKFHLENEGQVPNFEEDIEDLK
jgi:hypothetical protein